MHGGGRGRGRGRSRSRAGGRAGRLVQTGQEGAAGKPDGSGGGDRRDRQGRRSKGEKIGNNSVFGSQIELIQHEFLGRASGMGSSVTFLGTDQSCRIA